MTQNKLKIISERLANLHGYAYFRPDTGPLKERLVEAVLDAVSGDLAEQLAENPFDLEVNIGQQEDEGEVSLGYRVDYPGVEYSSQIAVTELSEVELEDLAGYLAGRPSEENPSDEASPGANTILRKKQDDTDYLEKGPAAGRLKVSPEWLKSVIPCTDYSYEEIEGKKYIREYYWSRELIERLLKIRSTKTTPEDLQYVAKECCEGDMEWARDLVARLKSPNRPEPAPREQSQKGQGKTAMVKQAQGKQGGKPGQQRTAAGKAQQAGQGAGNAAQAAAGSGERNRRSRHRRPMRDQAKEGGRKPEQGSGPKQSQ